MKRRTPGRRWLWSYPPVRFTGRYMGRAARRRRGRVPRAAACRASGAGRRIARAWPLRASPRRNRRTAPPGSARCGRWATRPTGRCEWPSPPRRCRSRRPPSRNRNGSRTRPRASSTPSATSSRRPADGRPANPAVFHAKPISRRKSRPSTQQFAVGIGEGSPFPSPVLRPAGTPVRRA